MRCLQDVINRTSSTRRRHDVWFGRKKSWPFSDFQKTSSRRLCPLGVFLPNFLHNFLRKIFLLLNSINRPGCHYFVRYWAICALQLFVNPVVASWIIKLILSLQSSHFFYMTKKSWQKFKYLENEKSF